MASPSILPRPVLGLIAFCVMFAPLRLRAEDPVWVEPPLLAQAPGAPVVQVPRRPAAAPKPAAQPSPPPAAPEPPAAPAAAPAAPVEPPAEPEPAELDEAPPLEEGEPPRLPSATNAGPKRQLELRLQELDRERAGTSNLVPWITVGVGAAFTLLATVVGAVNAFDCEPNTACTAPAWASLAVVAGAAMGTAGAIWVVNVDADIRDIEARRDQLRLDLEQFEYAGLGGPRVSFRFAF